MTISSLVITDGTVTATLTDGSNYLLQDEGWGPQLTKYRAGFLGRGPYREEDEEIKINVFSTPASLSATNSNLAKLVDLINQADRWYRGESGVSPVTLQITMSGGTMKQWLLLGGEVEASGSYVDGLIIQEIKDVTLKLRRAGELLGAVETSTTGVSSGIFLAQSVTFSSTASRPSPCSIKLSGFSSTDSNIAEGLILIAPSTNDIFVRAAEDFEGGMSGWQGITESGKNAGGGELLRLIPNIANTKRYPIALAVPTALQAVRSLGFAVTVRNNSSSVDFQLGIETAPSSAGNAEDGFNYASAKTNPIIVKPNPNAPRPVAFGSCTSRIGHQQWAIWGKANTTTDSLDIDQFVLFNADTTRVIGFKSDVPWTATYGPFVPLSLVVEDRSLTDMTPAVAMVNSSNLYTYLDYYSDSRPFLTGSTVAVVLIACRGIYWRYSNASNVVVNTVLTATRRKAYLVPE
jgi:hypothetical protein